MNTLDPEHTAPPRAGPSSRAGEPRYLELRLRRPTSAWPLARLATVTSSIGLALALILSPAEGLFAFWSLVVPLLPLAWLVAPGLWRNICPMAAANQAPRAAGLTRGFALPRWLERHGYAIAAVLFLVLVGARKVGLEESGVASAALILAAIGLAFAGGVVLRGKSAFCGGLCPLRPTQGLLAQAPVIKVATSHCRTCVGCTPNCPDLKPASALLDDLSGSDRYAAGYRRLFAGILPGFILAFFTIPAGAGSAGAVGQLTAFSLASLGAFFLLEQLAGHDAPGRIPALFAAAAFGIFYWFNIPVLAEAVALLAGADAPSWVIWEGRLLATGLALGWLALTLRRQARGGAPRPTAGVPLPLAAPAAPAAPAAAVPAPSRGRGSADGSSAAAAAPTPEVRLDPGPAASARPTAGEPRVPIPDRRAPEPRDRRSGESEVGDRRLRRFTIGVRPEGRIVEAAPGSSLLDACRAAGLPIEPGCQMGLCGNDPIYVLEGAANLSPAGPDEQATLERLRLPAHARMACATRLLGNVVVTFDATLAPTTTPASSGSTAPAKADTNGRREKAAGAPAVTADRSISRVVVLGNGIAGVTAADHVRRHHPECEIELVAEERHAFYNRTSVSRLVYSRDGMGRMYLLPPSWYADRRITTWLNTRATAVDRGSRRVLLGTGDSLGYDRLILATGASARAPAIEGFGSRGSFVLRGADDAMRLRSYVQRRGARRAIIVGGGVLGLEAAEAVGQLGLEATIVELAHRLAPVQLDNRAGRLLGETVTARNIETLLGHSVQAVLADESGVRGVRLDDGSEREAEVVVVCAGIAPNAELAREAGLVVGRGVEVDDSLRTSDDAIYAAGDVAEHHGHLYGHWTAAVEQAEAAATNAIGGRRPYKGSLIATHLKVTGIELTSIGRPHAEPDDTEIALEEEGGRYRKLVLSEGRIVGAILLGHPGRSAEVFAAARERRDLGRHIEALRQGDWRMLADPTPEPDLQSRPPASTNGHAENGSNGNTNGRHVPANGNGNGNGNGKSPAPARVL